MRIDQAGHFIDGSLDQLRAKRRASRMPRAGATRDVRRVVVVEHAEVRLPGRLCRSIRVRQQRPATQYLQKSAAGGHVTFHIAVTAGARNALSFPCRFLVSSSSPRS
jgi:hypothetical protein